MISMSIWELIFGLFVVAILGYFVLRGIRLAKISGFHFYLSAEVIEYVLPALLIFAQSFIVELSGINNPWKSFLAVGLIILAGTFNIIGSEQRRRWEQNAQEKFPERWNRWLGKIKQAGIVKLVDRLFYYSNTKQ
jgi:hypothetical protein